LMGPVKSLVKESGISLEDTKLPAAALAELIEMVENGDVSYSVASQQVLAEVISSGRRPSDIVREKNLGQESDSHILLPVVQEVLAQNAEKVKLYRSGKKGLLGMFMGEVMKKTHGKADPKLASQLLIESLE